MRQNSRKALIIGGGIAGPTTAIFLKQAGIDAEVFEAWPYATGIGGGLQIAPNGMHVLSEMGLADELVRRGSIAESFDFNSQSGARLGSVEPFVTLLGIDPLGPNRIRDNLIVSPAQITHTYA